MAESTSAEGELPKNRPVISKDILTKYTSQRSALVNEERSQRYDAAFRSSLSPIAKQACIIVNRIRDDEQANIWTGDVGETLVNVANPCVFPGMMFMHAKARIESTRLWKIVSRMPKGCLLHSHMDAMVDFHFLLDEILKLPGMHISSDRPLSTREAREDASISFHYRVNETNGASIWSEEYESGRSSPLVGMVDKYPDGGRHGFCEWIYSRCTLSLADSHQHHHGIDAIWEKFEKCFAVIAGILHYEPVFRALLRRLLSQLKADGVNWVELRLTWPLNYCRDCHEEPEQDYLHMFKVIEEEVHHFKESEEGRGFWGLTTIWASPRGSHGLPLIEHMRHCITTKLNFPNLIAGFDVVGAEDLGLPLVELLPELHWFRDQCAEKHISIPFFFHAGETLGDGDGADSNLFDAILLGTRRIGHGFSLFKHPRLIELVKEKQILIESCPISNEVLRLCGSILAHPLPALLARGVPCALSNDDPAVTGQDTAGVSHDFWQALQGWKNLGLEGLGSLAENSVRWAAFEDQGDAAWLKDIHEASSGSSLKAVRLIEWQREWESFCQWIVAEFGDEIQRSSLKLECDAAISCDEVGLS